MLINQPPPLYEYSVGWKASGTVTVTARDANDAMERAAELVPEGAELDPHVIGLASEE